MSVADAGRGPANAFFSHSAVTGPEGQFVFERVVPGTGRIGRDLSFTANDGAMEKESSSMVEVELLAGETTRLDLGGMGRAVIGRLEPPDGFTGKVLWNFARVDAAVPKWQKDKDANGWTVQTSRYDELRRLRPDITATVGWDGTFRLDDVKPGEYALDVRFSQHNATQLTDYRFEVPASGTGEPLDLGILKLAPEP